MKSKTKEIVIEIIQGIEEVLSDTEKEVLIYRLDDIPLSKIGPKIRSGVTSGRARQIEHKAARKLRRYVLNVNSLEKLILEKSLEKRQKLLGQVEEKLEKVEKREKMVSYKEKFVDPKPSTVYFICGLCKKMYQNGGQIKPYCDGDVCDRHRRKFYNEQ